MKKIGVVVVSSLSISEQSEEVIFGGQWRIEHRKYLKVIFVLFKHVRVNNESKKS